MRVIIWFLIGIWNNKTDRCSCSFTFKKSREKLNIIWFLRWVTIADCPGFLRDISIWMASKSDIPGGQPSIIPPSASPCDSPKVVILKEFQNPPLYYVLNKSTILLQR
jgi:hypothetical protein